MYDEIIQAGKGTKLRTNGGSKLAISCDPKALKHVILINNSHLLSKNVMRSDLLINICAPYMIINIGTNDLHLKFDQNISLHDILYDPYKFLNSEKKLLQFADVKEIYDIPSGYIDILAKWYSIKFTYPTYNLIFIKPEMGLSLQIHRERSEKWEVIKGMPIIINGNEVHYYVKNGSTFIHSKGDYHSIINPNKNPQEFVVIKEQWTGRFDENDITRVFNPNEYFS
jgi:mannose-6-phosphate isomerase-like protein (cupin superfamily)